MAQNKWLYLGLGIVLTVLFKLLNVDLCERLYLAFDDSQRADAFAAVLRPEAEGGFGLFDKMAYLIILMAWGVMGIYYYVIDSVKFDRWYHWLVMAAGVVVITPLVAYWMTGNVLTSYGMDFQSEARTYIAVNVLLAAVMSIIASFSLRWWSTNCRNTPIPQ